MREIYQELVNVTARGERAVLATVISSQGSTPRKAGAKMLIKEDGTFIGTIGGGGTEHKIRCKVSEVMKSGETQIVRFDLSGKEKDIDARPSDALALALRSESPIYVAEDVLDRAGIEVSEKDLKEKCLHLENFINGR